jgi:hypothetical protein
MRNLPVPTDLGPDPEPLGHRFEVLLDQIHQVRPAKSHQPFRTHYRRPLRSPPTHVQ